MIALFTALAFLPLLAHSQPISQVFPYQQAAQFGTSIVAHASGDGQYFLVDEVTVIYDDARPVRMCAVSREVVSKGDYAYRLRDAVNDNDLELVTCFDGGVLFVELREC